MDWSSVIEALRKALETNPEDIAVRLHLASLLEQSQRYQEALTEYRFVRGLQPSNLTAWLGIVRALISLQRLDEAHRELTELLKQFPDSEEAQMLLLRLRERGEGYDTATYVEMTHTATPSQQPVGFGQGEIVAVPTEPSSKDLGWSDERVTEGFFQLFRPERSPLKFADIGGLEDVKEQIRLTIIYPLQRPELYWVYGKQVGGGILLYGPPGCGKTLLARATAGECGLPFLYVGIDDILSPWMGESERLLHEAFETARENAPCVIFLDELDALGVRRTHTFHSLRLLVNQLLAELDGMEGSNEGILVLGATNSPWHLDPALLRPGRFDKVIFVPPPDLFAREAILRIHLRDKPLEPNFDFRKVAEVLRYFSGADIKGLCDRVAEEAIKIAFRTGKTPPLTTDAFLRVAKTMTPSTLEWLRTAKNYATYANQSGLYDPVVQWMERERFRG